MNRTYRTIYRSGLIGLLAIAIASWREPAEISRAYPGRNGDDQRIVFMVRDSWSIWRWLGALLLAVVTVGLVARGRGSWWSPKIVNTPPHGATTAPDHQSAGREERISGSEGQERAEVGHYWAPPYT